MDKVITSPLRYPGGKRWLFNTLLPLIPDGTKEMVSPFFGGGAVELNMAARGVKVYGYDICPHLVNFWQYWIENPSDFDSKAKHILMTYTEDMIRKAKVKKDFEGEDGAHLYYACNRVSFGGMTTDTHVKKYEVVGGRLRYSIFSDGIYRYVFSHSDFWQSFPKVALDVRLGSYQDTLANHKNIFAYIDPPYPKVGKDLYVHHDLDHHNLAKILHSRDNWVISYNNDPIISELYGGYHTISLAGRNFKTRSVEINEVLILSHDIAEMIPYEPSQLMLW